MFEICTAMLSKQPHYEFGLRSIKSVIQLSITMKASTMKTSGEEVILFNAVHRMKFSELLPEDQILFLRWIVICMLLFREKYNYDDSGQDCRRHIPWSWGGEAGLQRVRSFRNMALYMKMCEMKILKHQNLMKCKTFKIKILWNEEPWRSKSGQDKRDHCCCVRGDALGVHRLFPIKGAKYGRRNYELTCPSAFDHLYSS